MYYRRSDGDSSAITFNLGAYDKFWNEVPTMKRLDITFDQTMQFLALWRASRVDGFSVYDQDDNPLNDVEYVGIELVINDYI